MLRPVRLYNPKHMCKIILGGCRHEVKTFWELLLSARPEIYYSTPLLLEDQPCSQLLGLQLPANHVHLMDLCKDKHFSDFTNNSQRLPSTIRVLTGLGRLQLFLKFGLLLFQALDLLLQFINLSHMLSVSIIKLVSHSKSLIKALSNLCILLGQEVSVVHC